MMVLIGFCLVIGGVVMLKDHTVAGVVMMIVGGGLLSAIASIY